jgi:hypothetical protein
MTNPAIDEYLKECDNEFKQFAEQIYEFGCCAEENSAFSDIRYNLFHYMATHILNYEDFDGFVDAMQQAAGKSVGVDDDSIVDYILDVGTLLLETNVFLIEKFKFRYDLFMAYQEKLRGAFMLGAGEDVAQYNTLLHDFHRRIHFQHD